MTPGPCYIGIDLAWGFRARSGLAAVGADGALIASASVVSDDEIDGWLAALSGAVSVVAIDAPLVVTNPSGQRECERLIGAAFGRYAASCHSSNTGRPLFAPPRGSGLARRHRWSVDPAGPRPVALEVHPHAAMVGMFALPTVLPYKARSGRPFEVRLAAFEALFAVLESVAVLRLPWHQRWRELRTAMTTAERHVDLERIEDEVDGIYCAHLAWLWAVGPDALRAYGSVADGCIVAPPPPSHRAAPRTRSAWRAPISR